MKPMELLRFMTWIPVPIPAATVTLRVRWLKWRITRYAWKMQRQWLRKHHGHLKWSTAMTFTFAHFTSLTLRMGEDRMTVTDLMVERKRPPKGKRLSEWATAGQMAYEEGGWPL